MNLIKKRKAFSLIELLFVIVILGIVGSVALAAIKEYFEASIVMTEVDKRVAEADRVLEQITPYFENGIAESITRLDLGTGNTCYGPPDGEDINNRAIAFVSVDTDSRHGSWDAAIGRFVPGWSEDVNVSGNTIRSIGGNYNYANTIIGSLSPGNTIVGSAIYNRDQINLDSTKCQSYMWDTTNAWNVNGYGDAYLDITANPTANTLSVAWPTNITQPVGSSSGRYLLSTAYAFEVDNSDLNGDGISDGVFRMYNNFRPWLGEKFPVGNSNIITTKATNFSVFYDRSATAALDGMGSKTGMFYILKLCMRSPNDTTLDDKNETTQICRQRSVHVRY